MCAVAVAAEQTCPRRAVRATIEVLRLPSRRRITTIRTDRAGRFRISLAPGAYELVPSTSGSLMSARPVTVRVRAHQFRRVTIVFYPRHPLP